MDLAALVLALVTAERLAELLWARSNTARLMAAGGREVGASHYPLLVGLHAAWLAGLWLLPWGQPVDLPFLALFLAVQAGRTWVLATLRRRWTTRIIVVPGETLISAGPYRFMRHPNYAIVVVEIAALPLAFGLVGYALVFSAVNAVLLWVRIRIENEALNAIASPRAR